MKEKQKCDCGEPLKEGTMCVDCGRILEELYGNTIAKEWMTDGL